MHPYLVELVEYHVWLSNENSTAQVRDVTHVLTGTLSEMQPDTFFLVSCRSVGEGYLCKLKTK